MASVDEAIATFERNIHSQSGRSVAEWTDLTRGSGLAKHGQMVSWLKSEWGLSHGHANHIAKRALEALAPRSDDDPVGHIFAGGKETLRPLYDAVLGALTELGPDVEVAPKKANVSIRRRKQFALLQPGGRVRIDLGLILKDTPAGGRLEPSGSFNVMFTHRVKVAAVEEIDSELRGWMRAAYDGA